MAATSIQPPARAITAALAATVLVALAGLVLTGLEWSSLATSDAVGSVGAVAGAIAYAALGALIVRRAGNLVGWFMMAEGAATAVMTTGSAYAIFGAKAHPGTLPAAAAVGTLAEAVFVLVAIDLAALILVFPTGRLPSPRWRPAALAGLVLTGLTLASFVVSTRQAALPAPGGISLVYPNPLAIRSLQPVTWLGTLSGLALVFPLLLAGALVSLAVGYRRGDERLRRQMKWLGLAIAAVLATQAVGGLAIPLGQANKPLQQVPYAITPFLGDTLEFSVSDDGAGFPAGTSHGSGLQGMSDRIAAHGGTLTVRSRPGQGTTIAGRLPTSERTAAAGFPAASPG